MHTNKTFYGKIRVYDALFHSFDLFYDQAFHVFKKFSRRNLRLGVAMAIYEYENFSGCFELMDYHKL